MSNSYGFIKLGENLNISTSDIQSAESVLSDPEIDERFRKFANGLKRLTPKSHEFLYFSSSHSRGRSIILDNNGTHKLDKYGKELSATWDIDKNGSWKWVCSDSNTLPTKNSNGDIFPEVELLKAYKNWIGKPLCVDHKSNSVDAIRGVILDTYYDRKLHRVIALCALDKISYPELARKVSTGYSTSVSMGTAVAKAVCTDCGTVASAERDFCNHMKHKSGYGEINIGLQPIELSIVVSGADPRAKIRTIIAAAKEVVANSERAEELNKLEQDIQDIQSKIDDLKATDENSEEDSLDSPQEHLPYGASSGKLNPPSDEVNQESFGLNMPTRMADNNPALFGELQNLKFALDERLQRMESVLNHLTANHKEENNMSDKDTMNKKGYWQGPGGVNEPTPGKVKYPIDPLNEKDRSEDKHMVGEPPFPSVGDVDGLHPSPSSVDEKDELERKKMLLRAEQEQRTLRRAAALEKAKENLKMNKKEGYWQGAGGVNEPTPGKVKYPIDPLNEKDREKEDKQMVGQKPFPGVGDVEGLHPSPLSADEKDELKRKELLQRASLKAKFVRMANADGSDNLGDSAWQVYAKTDGGDRLLFTASVNDITGNRSDVLFDTVASKTFAEKMLKTVKAEGVEKAIAIYKKSQAVAGPGATPGLPADMGGAAPAAPDMGAPAPDAPPVADKGGDGDPKDTALKLADDVRDKASDLAEAVHGLVGDQAEMSDVEESVGTLPKAASDSLSVLCRIRRELNTGLIESGKKSLASLKEHYTELKLIAETIADDSKKDYVQSITEEAFEDAKQAMADASANIVACNNYFDGAKDLTKKASEANDAALTALASEEDETTKTHESSDESKADDCGDMVGSKDMSMPVDDQNLHDLDLELPGDEDPMSDEKDTEKDECPPTMDVNDVMMDVDPNMLAGKKVEVKASFDLTTKEGRSAYRAKLAASATGKQDNGEPQDVSKMKYNQELDAAHKLLTNKGQTQLDVKPSDNLGLTETKEEQQKKDLEIAKAPPKVRKDAERLNQLISEGKVSATQLDGLVAQGLDSEVVKYWKQFYGEGDKESSEFAKLLTTETMKAKAEEENKAYRVKVARAYELANDMVKRDLLADDRGAVSAQVDEIMKWNDEAFESMKRVIAKHPAKGLRKDASIPSVGLMDSFSAPTQAVQDDLKSELDRAFSGRRY